MKNKSLIVIAFCVFSFACSKKGSGNDNGGINHSPQASVTAELTSVNPFSFKFIVTATDQDIDPLTYNWDFGEGTLKSGTSTENFQYAPGKNYVVKVKVSDGKSTPVEVTANISTKSTDIAIDFSKNHQVMEGFGGFGAMKEYWASGPFESDAFVNTLINDLGLTILRDNLTSSFEPVNDNNDPFVTDLSKFNINSTITGLDEPLSEHLNYLKKMHDAGLQKLVISVWSPAVWMKYNNQPGNGTKDQNSAPAYTTNPTTTSNQLKTNMYDEFAEMCVAYVKILKQQTGIDIYALSIQNEPRFSQFYSSCVYDGDAMRDVLKVVGKRFHDEGLTIKLFLPEDVGYLQGVESMIAPTLADASARQYADIIAVHGYDLDGVTAASTSAQTWQTMYSWGAPYNKPLWMTETSGYDNTADGAMKLAKAMYTAIKFGNVSAWLHWSLSTTTLDSYSLMSSSGEKSKRYFVSKNFYKYIRPGAIRNDADAPDGTNIYPLAFQHAANNTKTIILINDNGSAKSIKLTGNNMPIQFNMFVTSATDDAKDYGALNSSDIILLQPNSVVTLFK
ncbi:MAG: PKD domain-containing protein [Ginsengibacter sp.]